MALLLGGCGGSGVAVRAGTAPQLPPAAYCATHDALGVSPAHELRVQLSSSDGSSTLTFWATNPRPGTTITPLDHMRMTRGAETWTAESGVISIEELGNTPHGVINVDLTGPSVVHVSAIWACPVVWHE